MTILLTLLRKNLRPLLLHIVQHIRNQVRIAIFSSRRRARRWSRHPLRGLLTPAPRKQCTQIVVPGNKPHHQQHQNTANPQPSTTKSATAATTRIIPAVFNVAAHISRRPLHLRLLRYLAKPPQKWVPHSSRSTWRDGWVRAMPT
jgi:hypothetical protein